MTKQVRALSTMTQWATRKYSPQVAMMKPEINPVLGPNRRLPRKKSPTTPAKANIAEGILTVVSDGPPKTLNTAASDA
ncbi:MAG: hypothetical protein A4E64_00982 [Syntrophorhabdus sp. PtaU1.Bin058]|nr:MAG: hypothetical protein A4E64_00982 [Syntrophorhabdus sp. PtaU1.Bin058]